MKKQTKYIPNFYEVECTTTHNLLSKFHTGKKKFLPVFQLPDVIWNLNVNWGYPLTNKVARQHHQLDDMSLSKISFWSVNNISDTWPRWWCHVLSPFIKGYHWSKFQLHSIRLINSFLSNINDNGDNNEKNKIFKDLDGNIPGGNFLGATFPGEIHQRGIWSVEFFGWQFSC